MPHNLIVAYFSHLYSCFTCSSVHTTALHPFLAHHYMCYAFVPLYYCITIFLYFFSFGWTLHVYIYVYYYLIVMHVFLPYVLFQARLTTYKAKCQFPYRVYDENTTYTTFQDNAFATNQPRFLNTPNTGFVMISIPKIFSLLAPLSNLLVLSLLPPLPGVIRNTELT